MRSRTGQQLLEWTSLRPSRPVAIDLTDHDETPPPRSPGRATEHESEQPVARRDACAEAIPAPTRRTAERRFRLDCLSREQLVDEIIEMNPSASVAFLREFDDTGLRRYLARLRSTRLGRGRASVAERPAGTPAISAHRRRG